MFTNIFISRMKINIRDKGALMWSLVFSLALGTLFYVAFHSIYQGAKNNTIPVAFVEGESTDYYDGSLSDMMDELTYDDGTKMLDTKTVDMTEAKKLLEKGEVDGIIDARDISDIRLIVAESGINQSILTSITSVFREYSALIVQTIQKDPSKIGDILDLMEEDVSLVDAKPLSGDNKDPYVAYFYSLIAMMCMMASMAGMAVPVSCQANLSDVGARVNVSPVSKGVYELAGLLAAMVIQTCITIIGLIYFVFLLKINFGGNIGFVFLTAVLGTILGVSLGFFIGHIGNISNKGKENILMIVIIGGGFLSGLMYLQMKMEIEKSVPIINRINPSAVITDAFYSLNMFHVSGRYYRSLTYMVVLTVVLIFGGLLMSRRKSYASL